MVTEAFGANLRDLLQRLGQDIVYQPFIESPGNVHTITQEVVNVEASYPAGSRKTIRALIDFAPSMATRSRLGLSENVAAVLTMLADDLTAEGLTPKVSDRVTITGNTEPFYVDKVTPAMLSGGKFYTQEIAVTRKTGGRRR